MKSKISFIAGVLLIFFSTAPCTALEDRIVAIVNDDVITLSELEVSLQRVMEKIEKIPEEGKRKELVAQARKAVINQMIDRMLLEKEAEKLKINVTDEEIERALEDLIKERGMSVEKFTETIAAGGVSLDDYRDEIRRTRIQRKVIGRTVESKVAVSEEEIGEYYAKHRNEYEGKEATRIQQILLVKPKNADESVYMKLKERAEEILKKLKEGESFDHLVETHSQGPAAGSGGDLGFVEKGMMFPEVDEVAFRLKVGEISDVIESPVGLHIIKILDRRGAGIKPIGEVRGEIIGKIGNEKMKKKFDEWLKELKKKSFIEIRL